MEFEINNMKIPTQLPGPPPNQKGWPWYEGPDPLPKFMPDGRPWPKISIITPSFNQGQFLEETIRSVLLQGYPNLEYIIIDGASSDNSVAIIKKYEPWITSWVSEKDRGQSYAINKGFAMATGEIYAWLNSDDVYLPDTFLTVAHEFSLPDKDFDVLVGNGQKVDLDGRIIFAPQPFNLGFEYFLDWGENQFSQPSCFFTKEAWQSCGPIREDLYSALDLDLWLRMSKKFSFKKIDHLLAYAKAHDLAKTTNRSTRIRGRVESSILLIQNGGTTYPQKELFDMADDLAEAYDVIDLLLKDKPAYRLAGLLQAMKRKFLKGRM